MSCYAWEHGTIVLPSGQAPSLRQALTKAADDRIAKLTADTGQKVKTNTVAASAE